MSIPDIDFTKTSVSGTSNCQRRYYLLLPIRYSNFVRSGFNREKIAKSIDVRAHLNPNASHLKPLIGVWHPVKQAQRQASTKAGHHDEVVGKEQGATSDPALTKIGVPCVAERVQY